MQDNAIYRQALLLGCGWTLAGGAALAYFKSGAFAPIYLWTLGVVALGWALLLSHALAGARRAASAALAAACGETRAAIDGLAQALGAEMQRASKELLRVDELLAHAIDQLLSAFNSVADQASSHQQTLASAAAAAQGTPAADRLRVAAERVARDVNGAVTALQFRDVVGQKLGHVRRELEALEQVMYRMRELSSAQAQATQTRTLAPGQTQLAAGVWGLLNELQQTRAASPAQQELMHAGEVDLF